MTIRKWYNHYIPCVIQSGFWGNHCDHGGDTMFTEK